MAGVYLNDHALNIFVDFYILAYPEYNGGAIVTEFAAQMISPDNNSRECYKGRDLDCIVAGLSPGRPYLFQVRAFNRAGVRLLTFPDTV